MRYATFLLILVFVGFEANAIASDERDFAADGVVVAVQKTKDEARMYDLHSMGDLVEVWMVRVDKWTLSERPTFILVEYTHRDAILKDSELDSTVWRLDIRPGASGEKWNMHELVDTDLHAHCTWCQPETSAAEGTRVFLDAKASGSPTTHEGRERAIVGVTPP